MFKYLQYYLMTALSLCLIPTFLLGGHWLWGVFILMNIIMIAGDAVLGDDTTEKEVRYPWLIEGPLFLALPVLTLALITLAWTTGRGNTDVLGIGVTLSHYFSYDFFAARESTTWYDYVGGILSAGFAIAGYGTNVGHELTHRSHSAVSMFIGRWLLSMSCNADFAIEHVYGHHLNVGTEKDPATARRGENVYAFILRSSVMGHLNAWNLELERLKNRGFVAFSLRNRMLTGYAMSVCWLALFAYMGGVLGVGIFLAQAFCAKCVLEIVNYLEHYGMHRDENEPIMPHHSWNSNKRMSGMILFSLTRHSAHHEKGQTPFWQLPAYPDAPTLPEGYLTSIFICLVPPLWRKIIGPRLDKWEEEFGGA